MYYLCIIDLEQNLLTIITTNQTKMKKLLLLLALLPLFISCGSDSEDTVGDNMTQAYLSGKIEKGPFVQGSKVTLYDLDSKLAQTGKSYTTNTNSDLGAFYFDNTIQLSSKYGEFDVNGYFYNECDSSLSTAPVTLKAIASLDNKDNVNINILTHLEYARVKYLIKNGSAFHDAKRQAEKELLKVFAITDDINNPENISITDNNSNSAILLAISSIMLYGKGEAAFSEFISKFSNDFETDGTIDEENIVKEIREGQKNCHPTQIVHAMKRFYSEKGSDINISDFSKYIDFNGDGIIDSNDQEESDVVPVDYIVPENTLNTEENIKQAINGLYLSVSGFAEDQSALESLRMSEGTGSITAMNTVVGAAWEAGYNAITLGNNIYMNIISGHNYTFDTTPYLNEIRALEAYVYYNMAMLWGNIIIVMPQNADEAYMTTTHQSTATEVYSYCQNLLSDAAPLNGETGHVDNNFINTLKAEIELSLGNNATAKSALSLVSTDYEFAFNYNGTSTTIYSPEYIKLLVKEAEGEDNYKEWENHGAKHGTWAALKRLGKAAEIFGLSDYELLMPIPSNEMALNTYITQNPGY